MSRRLVLASLALMVAFGGAYLARRLLTASPSPSRPDARTASPGRLSSSAPGQNAVRFATAAIEVMGTRIQLLVAEADKERAAREVFSVFRRVDRRMSEWKGSSPLSAVNRAAGRAAVKVPVDLRAVLRRGIEIGHRTGGAFDVTWAALWGLWSFKAKQPRVPAADEIARRVALVDYRQVEVDDEAGTVRLPRAGMLLGLGAIGKGYALDQAAARLRGLGIRDFMIVAGGQVLAGGGRSGRPWRVGLRDPRGDPGDYFAKIELSDSGVSTSGDYERYFVIDGVRYHHILDPKTGRPARSGLRSASVIAADATLADALSTAMMILGVKRSLALAESWPGVEVVLVDQQAKIHVTRGIRDRLSLRHPPKIR